MRILKHRAERALKFRVAGALIILAGGAMFLLFGCAEETAEYGPYVCANGTAAEGTTATPNETRCVVCNQGYRLDGHACAVNTYTCVNGVAAPGRPRSDSEERCVRCNSGYRLVNESCAPTTHICAFGAPAAGQPQTHNEARCASCDAGFHLENNLCVQNRHACPNGDPFGSQAVTEGAVRCTQCDAGYHLNAQEACEPNAYVCDNGTAARVKPNERPEAHNQQLCVSCDADYSVYADAVTASQTCGGNKYICFNGDAVDEVAPVRGEPRCANCDVGYRLESESCVAHEYSCPNGTAARGIPAIDNEPRCVACDNVRYILVGVECVLIAPENPLGLAAIGSTLYMIGGKSARLYTVDTATAHATVVNPALGPGFGVGEAAPAGMTAIGDTLYMVGSHHDRLYTLDTDTGAATPVGGAYGFGVGESEPWGIAAVGGQLYMTSGGPGFSTTRFYAVNAATGVASFISEVSLGYWRALYRARGLAAIGNTLYLVMEGTRKIFIVNTATGELRDMPAPYLHRNGDQGWGVGEYHPSGLTAIGNTLYMGGLSGLYSDHLHHIGSTSRLYTVNSSTGRATVVRDVVDVADDRYRLDH